MPQDETPNQNEHEQSTDQQTSLVGDEPQDGDSATVDVQAETAEAAATESQAVSTETIQDGDLAAAKAAWDGVEAESVELTEEEQQRLNDLAAPFVGQWKTLISTTNWEKGRIISQWRQELIDSGLEATQYSDDAWAKAVGGVTGPHVGRLRRVFDRFKDDYQSYEGLYWTHFLAALDWSDAPLWLEGATKESWSISQMREARWKAEGAVADRHPSNATIIEVDTDEDGGDFAASDQGDEKRGQNYDGGDGSVAQGPVYEPPDFGDEEELQAMPGQAGDESSDPMSGAAVAENPVQPFIDLPELPADLQDAVDTLKLSLLRHKATQWRDVSLETVEKYLSAIGVMVRS
jgi:hypothetical protein